MTEKSQLPLPIEGESKVELFQKREIRKTIHGGEWWFAVKDILEALTDTTEGNRYSRDLRNKDAGLKSTWAEITRTLPFDTGTRGVHDTTFINIEGIFRLMQSVPSIKAEPFKKWIARVGFERLQEIQNPELAVKRAIALYQAKGYSDGWIDTRIRNTLSRKALTDEWDKRGIAGLDYALLTDAISVETFGITTRQHQLVKGLKGQSLRDNMTPIELTLTTLGEQTTTEITRVRNAHGKWQNLDAAKRGGQIAGAARKEIEEVTGEKVVSASNYLTDRQKLNNDKGLPDFDGIIKRLLPQERVNPS